MCTAGTTSYAKKYSYLHSSICVEGNQDFFEGGMSMYYEINVSLDGVHLFATTERSAQTKYALDKILTIFKEKFPKKEGYAISVAKVEIVRTVL